MRGGRGFAVVGLAVAALVAGCGGGGDGGGPSAAEWSESVCGELGEWRAAIIELADVEGELTPGVLEEKLAEADEATDELVGDLQRLGPPDVENGAEVERALDDAAAGIRESFDALRSTAESALDASSPSAFLQELAALAPDFQALVQRVEDTLAALQSASLFGEASGELERAFADAPSCVELREAG